MIPQFEAKIVQKVDLKKLAMPPERILASESGLMCNHSYRDLRGYWWDDYLEIADIEREIVESADKKSKTPKQFERLVKLRDDEMLDGIEAGVSGLVVALSALGCAPASSCRGHPNNHEYNQPYVAFWATPTIGRKILPLVRGKEIAILNYNEFDFRRGLLIYSKNILPLMSLARALYEHENPQVKKI